MHEKIFNICSDIIKKYSIYILLTIAFVPAFITVITRAYGPMENYGWNILYYHVGYETGFGGRKLLASFCHLIFPDYVHLRHIRTMVLAINFLMVVLFVFFVSNCFKKCNKVSSLWLVLALYIICPFSLVAFMSSGLSVAFAETYQIALTLLWLLIWMKHRGKWPFYLATLLIAVTCCLLHHTFCCTLFPMYIGLFIYDIIDRNRLIYRNLFGYGIVCLSILGLLVIIWGFSHMTITIDQLNEWFNKHVAIDAYECSREAQTAYYYMTNDENYASQSNLLNWGRRFGELSCSILMMLPLLVMIYYPWVRASHTAPTRLSAWKYRLIWILITALTSPIFIIATDYSRWLVCFFLSMFAATMAVLCIGDKYIIAAALKMTRFFEKHPIITISLVIYIFGLHITPCGDQYGLKEGIDLWYFIKGIFL